jgi:aryl-alcohol dehydrogenase-like predicted oxidoreductase
MPKLISAAGERQNGRISNLGLGCVTFGREIDRAAAFAMMDHATARGMYLFDTAAAYGAGASETIVGEWLARGATSLARKTVTVSTKILPPYAPTTLSAAIDASLRRLNVATIDVLFLHRWDESAADPATLRALDGLVRSGRVRALGASNFSAAQLESVLMQQTELGLARFRAVQNIHNYAVRGIDAAMRDVCAHHDVSIMTYSPLGAGFLTGKHELGVQRGTRFDIIPGHQDVYFNDLARHRLARLKEVAARSGVPMIQLALAWAVHQPQVATVLVGGRTPAHLDQAVQALTFNAPALLAELDGE